MCQKNQCYLKFQKNHLRHLVLVVLEVPLDPEALVHLEALAHRHHLAVLAVLAVPHPQRFQKILRFPKNLRYQKYHCQKYQKYR